MEPPGCSRVIWLTCDPLEWNTPQLLSRAVQQIGRVLEVKHDTSGRIRIEIDLKLPHLFTSLFQLRLQQVLLLSFPSLPLSSHQYLPR